MTRSNPRVTIALLARRARALKRQLKLAAAGEGRGVHQARVASRRLREAIPVLAAGLQGTKAAKARKKIRRLTRALGAIRELDVTLGLIDELSRRETLPRPALEQVRAHAVKARDARQPIVEKRLSRVNVAKLDRRLNSLSESLRTADADYWKEALAERLVKRSKRLQEAVQDAGKMYEAERLHRVRLATKKLRYATELAAETGTSEAARPVQSLKRMQNMLGRLHDVQVLQSHVAAVQADPPTTAVADASFEQIARSLEEECRHLHARYVAAVPTILAAIEQIRVSVIPQLLPLRVRKSRVLKMDLPTARAARKGRGALLQAGAERS
jgi:CHAD domain-containing protein